MSERLFVAVDLPDALVDDVADAQAPFADAEGEGLRLTDPSQAHVTLQFLGDVESSRVPDVTEAVEDALDAAGVTPFAATVGGYGVFPSREYVSVVWTGFRRGGAELTRLHEAVERETARLGFAGDDHEFTPHVTLARVDDARPKALVLRVLGEADPEVGSFRVGEVRLKRSTLTPDGPEYETVARAAL
jgi:2'-5' RNA ligase